MSATSFAHALEAHLTALQRRDIDAFAETVGSDVTVVDGQGTITDGRDAILEAHRDWFASPDAWEFGYDVVQTREFASSAYGLVNVRYRQRADATTANFLLVLIFELETAGTWKFVFDQNTSIARGSSS